MQAEVYIAKYTKAEHRLRATGNGCYPPAHEMVEPDSSRWIAPMVRRRLDRLSRTGLTLALQCLEGIERVDAVITATSYGYLAETIRFGRDVLEKDERLVSPTPFMQSTFNTLGGQIAVSRKLSCYNNTHVQGVYSFALALQEAYLLLQDAEYESVLVGAFDELTPYSEAAMRSRGVGAKYGFGEGVAFFILTTNPKDANAQLEEVCVGCGSTVEEGELVLEDGYQSECGEYGTAQAYGLAYALDSLLGSGKRRAIRVSAGNTVADIVIRGV